MDLIQIAILLVVILLSMTLHEAMHAFMGYFLGDDTAKASGRLTLNPLRHIDPFMTILLPIMLALVPGVPIFGGAKPVPFNPHNVKYGEWGAALVALAGPLTNLLLAFVAFGVGAVSGLVTAEHGFQGSLGGQLVEMTILVNLGFFVFNMIPIPPLDGSRVLYTVAPEMVRRAMVVAERYGILIVFAVVIIFQPVIFQVMTVCIQAILQLFMTIFRL